MLDKSAERDREASLKLFVVLSKAYKTIMDYAMRDMKRYGFSASEFMVLELLYHKGRCPLQQIGSKILVTSGSITYNVDKLEKKGYLKRVPCEEDRRVTYAEITDEGRKLFDDIFPDHAEAIMTIMSGLTTDEKDTATAMLKKLGLEAQKKL